MRAKRRASRARPAWLTAIVLCLAACPLLAWVAAQGLIVESELARADALVVLAGSAAYRERTRHAAQLFSEGRAPKIILTNDSMKSGWSNELQRNPSFAERAAEELRRGGVPAERIEVVPQKISGTYQEVMCVSEYAAAHGIRSVLVVTSAYHSRRTLWTLRRVFRGSGVMIGLDPAPAGLTSPPPATWWWYALGWRMVPGEYLKMLYYLVRYR